MGKGRVVNEYEVRVWAIRRSGHHAVINWIASLFDKPVFFCNNVKIGMSPYSRTPGLRGKELVSLYYPTWKEPNRVEKFKSMKKQCLIYNHENKNFKMNGAPMNESLIGRSSHRFDILIMRDLRNLLASHLVNYKVRWGKIRKVIAPLYQLYAEEFLGETNYLQYQPVKIWFDQWVQSEEYRIKKAEELGFKNKDWSLQYMANFYKRGSHFDKYHDYYNRAHEMEVTKRYKMVEETPRYLFFMKKNKHLLNLSKTIHEREGGIYNA